MTKSIVYHKYEPVMRDVAKAYRSSVSRPGTISSIDELTRGVSGSHVFRVHVDTSTAEASTVIVKVSTPGAQGIRIDAGGSISRELSVYDVPLTAHAARYVMRPKLLARGESAEMSWMMLEDVGPALDVEWDVSHALTAMRAVATLDVGEIVDKRSVDWFSPREHHAFEHHIDAARDSLERLRNTPDLKFELGEQIDLDAIVLCLDTARAAASELDDSRHGFQHGDLNNSNMGFDEHGALMLVDWAQAGLAPIGSDVAVFLSGFLAFGGTRGALSQMEFDELVIAEFSKHYAGSGMDDDIRRVVDLWTTSWAVESRLGVGLPAAWQMDQTTPARAFIVADVREGLLRAVRAAERLGA